MRIITILSILLSSVLLSAQSKNYEIFDFKAPVCVKFREATSWCKAKKGALLELVDSVRIEKGGEIRILNICTKEVYRSNKRGDHSVKEIFDEAKQQSKNMLSAIFAQLQKNNSNATSSMKMIGATTRGQSTEEDAIAQTIVYVVKESSTNDLQYSSDLELITHNTDSEIYFSMTNKSNKNYCVNVVSYNRDKQKVALCYALDPSQFEYPYIVLFPNETIDLPMWHFASPTSKEQYILIATEHIYDTYHVQEILQCIEWDKVSEPAYKNYIFSLYHYK